VVAHREGGPGLHVVAISSHAYYKSNEEHLSEKPELIYYKCTKYLKNNLNIVYYIENISEFKRKLLRYNVDVIIKPLKTSHIKPMLSMVEKIILTVF